MIYLCASDPAALLFAGLVQVALDPLGPVLFEMRIADHVVARERHDWFCKQQQQQQRNYQGQLQVSGILLRIATQNCGFFHLRCDVCVCGPCPYLGTIRPRHSSYRVRRLLQCPSRDALRHTDPSWPREKQRTAA